MGQQPDLYRLIYVSDQTVDAPSDPGSIADDSRLFNAQLHVTGVLWFDGTHFLQLLEGSKDAVNTVFRRIVNSRSHADIDIICFERADKRTYGDWAMSYFGSQSHNRKVAENYAGGPDMDLRLLSSNTLLEMLAFLEEERQQSVAHSVE